MKRTNIQTFIRGFAIGLMLVAIAYAATAHACTGFFLYEEPAGFNKICYYDHLGDKVAITIKSVELCPLTIKVRH